MVEVIVGIVVGLNSGRGGTGEREGLLGRSQRVLQHTLPHATTYVRFVFGSLLQSVSWVILQHRCMRGVVWVDLATHTHTRTHTH